MRKAIGNFITIRSSFIWLGNCGELDTSLRIISDEISFKIILTTVLYVPLNVLMRTIKHSDVLMFCNDKGLSKSRDDNKQMW